MTPTDCRSSCGGGAAACYVWGRVRPGKGIRYAQLERRSGSSFVKDGAEIATNSSGYFKVNRSRRATYRFPSIVT